MSTLGLVAQLRDRVYETRATTALVRGSTAPPRPDRTVTVAPCVAAPLGPVRRRARLRVTADAPDGATVRRYGRSEARAAVDRVAAATADREPTAVWLCDRTRLATWWSAAAADRLERRLADAIDGAAAPLVVWSPDGSGAVGDAYDVVLDP